MKNESVSWIIYHLHFDLHSRIWLRSDIMGSSVVVVSLPGYTLLPPRGLLPCGDLTLALSTPFCRSINYMYDLGRYVCRSSMCGRDDKASLSHCGILWINSYLALWGSLLLLNKPANVCL